MMATSSTATNDSEKKTKKLPACDVCKARRVLCHPQPNGAPCPRCRDKDILCTTTPVTRGRPRKYVAPSASSAFVNSMPATSQPSPSNSLYPQPSSSAYQAYNSSGCPELTPELVAHLFECFSRLPQYLHPIITDTCIKTTISSVSFQLHLLPPQYRVLALSIMALASSISFDVAVLGEGPRPASFVDETFFFPGADLRSFGVRRAPVCRALHSEALRAAWDSGIMLETSDVNAASCFVLDLLEQRASEYGFASRPWATAYISQLRALAPTWKISSIHPDDDHWAGFLMGEAMAAMRSRSPVLTTLNDQLLISGPEPPSLKSLLISLEAPPVRSEQCCDIWQSMRPFTFHVTYLARQLYETISGDYARLNPLSETAVTQFLASLSDMYSVLLLLLDRVDTTIRTYPAAERPTGFGSLGTNMVATARACSFGYTLGFASVVIALDRELQYRDTIGRGRFSPGQHPERMSSLRKQVRDMAHLGARVFAKGLRYLPNSMPRTHMQWRVVHTWAEFCLNEADATMMLSPDDLELLETILNELKIMGYAADFPASTNALVELLDGYVCANRSPAPVGMTAMSGTFLPMGTCWMENFPAEDAAGQCMR
ncbi:hypothetical protein B0H10DRAFT_738999 [Mycena sp. CBHHK59/15]|nr:hypothetical protein B0H10DRAFT_738999 [Mycena sp. CBHHK59/15]